MVRPWQQQFLKPIYIKLAQKQEQLLLLRLRHYYRNMDSTILMPPTTVRGMKILQREAFEKCVSVPILRVREQQTNEILPLVKTLLLKMEKLRAVRVLNECSSREILLHPVAVVDWHSLPTEKLLKKGVDESNFDKCKVKLQYDNFNVEEIFKSVLPEDKEGLASYSRIGHILHLNIREHLLPYKQLIGEVLLDKVPNCKTVVNKSSIIDNTYRNFEFELICGKEEYNVETRENGSVYEFDFSKVYWNPRLSTEHERIVKFLQIGDVVYDVFAGVGPFSVPAARKKCEVYANDLNPNSYIYLKRNAVRNKCKIKSFNKDGRDFIMQDVKEDLLKRWRKNEKRNFKIYVIMNLPAIAVEFLSAFRGLFADEASNIDFTSPNFKYPIVHVYVFAKGDDTKSLARELVEKNLGMQLADNLESIYFVRNVAPNKDMYRVAFKLTKAILTTSADQASLKRKSTDTAATAVATKLKHVLNNNIII